METVGVSAEAYLGDLHLYLEGNLQQHDNFKPDSRIGFDDVRDESGYAAFGEISYNLAPFNLRAELQYYKRWMMEGGYRGNAPIMVSTQTLVYHHVVTLEPVWMIIKSLGNSWGGRLTGDAYIARSKTQVILSATGLKYEGGVMPDGSWSDHPTNVFHPILKLRQDFAGTGIHANFVGGYRFEWPDSDDSLHEGVTGRLWHVAADVTYPFWGNF